MSEALKREIEEMESAKKPLPNDKKALMDAEHYETYNQNLMRKVFPRIINEFDELHGRKQRKPQIRDIIVLYFYLLSYVDGKYIREDGTISARFGASFPSKAKITGDLGIAEQRIRPLIDILKTNGLILDIRDVWEGTNRYKWYFVSFCPRISDDGYIVDENGEKVKPDLSLYK